MRRPKENIRTTVYEAVLNLRSSFFKSGKDFRSH